MSCQIRASGALELFYSRDFNIVLLGKLALKITYRRGLDGITRIRADIK